MNLERSVDQRVVMRRRAWRDRDEGPIARLAAAADAALRTEAVEYLDRPDVAQKAKLRIARGVHLMNLATLSYRRFLRCLEPTLREVAQRRGRPARLLELASGCGGFALALADLAGKVGIPVHVTGSDVVPLYVETARRIARERRVTASFRLLDALAMPDEPDAYDVVFVAQSMHHFAPGQLARIIAESRRIATTAFVGIDGRRSLFMLGVVSLSALLSLQPMIVHDAVVSARKFYGDAELEIIGRCAAPFAAVGVHRLAPFNSVLTVRFDHEERRR